LPVVCHSGIASRSSHPISRSSQYPPLRPEFLLISSQPRDLITGEQDEVGEWREAANDCIDCREGLFMLSAPDENSPKVPIENSPGGLT
jgi:hypothetical protein